MLPAQAYPSGLTIQLQTDEGYMEVETENNLVFSQSELREMPTLDYMSTVGFAGKWRRSISSGQSIICVSHVTVSESEMVGRVPTLVTLM